jgi:hypothetical protein
MSHVPKDKSLAESRALLTNIRGGGFTKTKQPEVENLVPLSSQMDVEILFNPGKKKRISERRPFILLF